MTAKAPIGRFISEARHPPGRRRPVVATGTDLASLAFAAQSEVCKRSKMSDDEIALKLMRLYKQLRQSYDPAIRQTVCDTIDALVAQLKHAPGLGRQHWIESGAHVQPGAGDD